MQIRLQYCNTAMIFCFKKEVGEVRTRVLTPQIFHISYSHPSKLISKFILNGRISSKAVNGFVAQILGLSDFS